MSLDSTTFVQYGPLSGTLPIGMRAGADQAAVTTTAATSTTPFGFGAAAQADAIVALCNEMRATLVAAGLMKGEA